MSFLKGQKKGNDNIHTAEATRAGEALEGLMEKVGMYAMEKQSVSVEEIKENFNTTTEQAEKVVDQLEKIGVLDKADNGQHKVIMDKEAFLNRIRGYKELAQRMQNISAAQSKNLVDITITKKLIVEENDRAVRPEFPVCMGIMQDISGLTKKTQWTFTMERPFLPSLTAIRPISSIRRTTVLSAR